MYLLRAYCIDDVVTDTQKRRFSRVVHTVGILARIRILFVHKCSVKRDFTTYSIIFTRQAKDSYIARYKK